MTEEEEASTATSSLTSLKNLIPIVLRTQTFFQLLLILQIVGKGSLKEFPLIVCCTYVWFKDLVFSLWDILTWPGAQSHGISPIFWLAVWCSYGLSTFNIRGEPIVIFYLKTVDQNLSMPSRHLSNHIVLFPYLFGFWGEMIESKDTLQDNED